MANKVQVYDAVSGEVYSVPIEGFKSVNDELEVDVEEAMAWIKKHKCKYEYDEEGDIAVSDITWQ